MMTSMMNVKSGSGLLMTMLIDNDDDPLSSAAHKWQNLSVRSANGVSVLRVPSRSRRIIAFACVT